MSIVSVDNIQPIGSGTTVTVNSAATLVLNNVNSTGVVTATTFVGNLTGNPTGTLQTAAQPNITSVGTLSALTVSGNINVSSTDPTIVFVDSDNNPDFDIKAGGGRFAIRDSTNNTERLRIASDGKIFVSNEAGTIDTTARLGEGNRFQLSGLSSNDGISVVRYNSSYGAWGLNLGRSKSNTLGTNVALQDNDDIGHVTFWGADGSDFNMAAQISAEVDGTPSNGTDMPGALVFKTTGEASGTPSERLRIDSNGYVTQANRPAFDAGVSTGAVSATNPIVFNNAQVNRGNCYNTSNGRFTAPVTGLYFFYYGGLKDNNSNVLRLKLRKGNGTYLNNGREFRLDEQGGNYAENASMCIIVSLTANEYVQVYVTEGSVYGQYNAYTYFGGYLLA